MTREALHVGNLMKPGSSAINLQGRKAGSGAFRISEANISP